MIIIDWRSISSMTPESEQMKLEEWVRDHWEKIDRPIFWSLEIGTYHGQSAAVLAQFGEVWAVDLWGNVDVGLRNYDQVGKHHFAAFNENMIRLELIERVFPICSTSKALCVFEACTMDIIHIDAGHQYEDVKQDIEESIRLLDNRGLMIFDDYKRPGFGPEWGTNDPWEGVARAVDELLATGKFVIYEHFEGKVALRRK